MFQTQNYLEISGHILEYIRSFGNNILDIYGNILEVYIVEKINEIIYGNIR